MFAALSGSSMASTALLGTLMVPEMKKRGYKNRLSIGPILGVGGLAILIPPSALAVLLGSLAYIDIGMLLIAGIVPGLVLATLYGIYIIISIRLDPDSAPAYDVSEISSGTKGPAGRQGRIADEFHRFFSGRHDSYWDGQRQPNRQPAALPA